MPSRYTGRRIASVACGASPSTRIGWPLALSTPVSRDSSSVWRNTGRAAMSRPKRVPAFSSGSIYVIT
jgi:hypothetical protein